MTTKRRKKKAAPAPEQGEIRVQAASGGRRITLDPWRTKQLQIGAREVESTLPCGLRQEWVSGEVDGVEFQCDVGAGLGSPWLSFQYKGRAFCIHVRDIVTPLIQFAKETEDQPHGEV